MLIFFGIGVIILYAISGNTNGYHMTRMVAAIIISFGCYLPVTLFSKTKPKVWIINDSKDLCIYVDYCNGTSAFILTKYSKNASSSTGGSKLLDCGFRRAGKPTAPFWEYSCTGVEKNVYL